MTTDRVMLLIDADNVSVDVMEQAVRLLLNQHGALHVRRAGGRHDRPRRGDPCADDAAGNRG